MKKLLLALLLFLALPAKPANSQWFLSTMKCLVGNPNTDYLSFCTAFVTSNKLSIYLNNDERVTLTMNGYSVYKAVHTTNLFSPGYTREKSKTYFQGGKRCSVEAAVMTCDYTIQGKDYTVIANFN